MTTEATGEAVGTAAANERVFRAMIGANARGDIEGVLSHYTEDAAYIDMCEPHAPIRGLDGLRGVLDAFYAVLDVANGSIAIASLTAQEDRAVGELEARATYVGDGAPAGGVPVVLRMCVVLLFRDGKIREERVYMEPASSQIGRALEA